ncbi:4'-phosphopantetheinyl transferase family protein [Citricoccus sp. CH26A]|uniref:4'-phosphopantetheinyl transferase family protein n=1 Tax=Citricoccus TaxID=169133 RepID=UPI0002E61515|nr:4'-phosphopantetheinyl transferase superfamily protein [Citricoccus sp. CH26A]
MTGPGWHVVVTGPRAGDQRREALDYLAVSLGHRPGTFEVEHHCPACGSAEHGAPVLRYSRLARRRHGPDAVDPARVLPAVSFSRSRGWLATAWLDAALVADGWRIGVDIEELGSSAFATADELGAVGFSVAEASAIAGLPPAARPLARARLWSAKEALVKARGTGFRGDPAGVPLVPADEGPDDPDVEDHGLTWSVPGSPRAVVSADPHWPGGAAPEGLVGAVVVLPPSS